uniref:Si:ch211-137i24.10 n=1 Tax=Sinocyclocheilus grahami TaxID=75366 RepID=A0A672QED5_SINGR
MCTGKCALCVGTGLYPLAVISIICNIILFFPGWDVKYAQNGQITEEVKYMGGLIGGGILVLIPAFHIHLTGKQGCCANRCGMFLSILFAAVGVVGALYSFVVALMGLINGPYCKYYLLTHHSILMGSYDAAKKDIILYIRCNEMCLCSLRLKKHIIFGCLCGTCKAKGVRH